MCQKRKGGKLQFQGSVILRDNTMDHKLIPNDVRQNYQFCRLTLFVEKV